MDKPIFVVKKFNEINLGKYLHDRRKKLKLSLKKVAEQILVNERYLKALEKNNFSKLPPEIYVKGFIKRYCYLLGLDNGKALYFFEKSKLAPKKDNPIQSIVSHFWFSKFISYRNLIFLLIIFFFATSVFYLFNTMYPMYANPYFVLAEPNVCPFQTQQEKIELKGIVQPESKVWINNEETLTDKEGNFHCYLFLKEGENLIKFRVVSKFGKERNEECTIRKN